MIALLWLGFFLININVAIMLPLLPFLRRDLGLSTVEVGLALAAFPLVALTSNLLLGPFIDKYGRKWFIVAGAAGSTVIYILTAACYNGPTLVACRATVGVFMPMVGASIFSAMSDYVPEEMHPRVSGYIATAAPIAFLVAMSSGMWLGGLIAWQLPILSIAALALTLTLAATQLPPTPKQARAAGRITLATYRRRLLSFSLDSATRFLLIAYATWSTAVYIFLGLYPTWLIQRGLSDRDPYHVGAVLLIGEVGGLTGALFSGWIVNAFRQTARISATAATLSGVVVASIPLAAGILPLQMLEYLAFAFLRDLMLALILGGGMRLVVAAERGSLNALLNALYQSGAASGGMISAFAYAQWDGYGGNAMLSSGLFLLCAGFLLGVRRTNRIPEAVG